MLERRVSRRRRSPLPLPDRGEALARSMIGMVGVRGAAIVVAVVSMPVYIRFFPEAAALGVWFTLLTVVGWLLTLDLGVGNGMRNLVSTALALEDRQRVRSVLSAGYLLAISVAVVLAAAVGPLIAVVDWNVFFNVSPGVLSASALQNSVAIAVLAIALQLVLRNVSAILLALQKPIGSAFLPLATSVGMLVAVLWMEPRDPASDLVRLAWVYLAASSVPYVLATLWVFGRTLSDAVPTVGSVDRRTLKSVASLGGGFFGVQLMYMALVTTDTPLVAWLATPEAVVQYQIYVRPFGLIGSLFVLALTPVWSAVTGAWARGDVEWIGRTYSRLSLLALVASAATLVLTVVLQPLVDVWLGSESITIEWRVSLAFAMLAIAMIWNSLLSSVVSGIGEVRVQLMAYGAGVLVKVPIAVLLCQAIGWAGVVWAAAAALSMYCVLAAIWVKRQLHITVAEEPTAARSETDG